MNKNGFTLVELLAVIVLLGLVLVITMTNGLGIFNKAKGGINKIEEDNLIEAAKVFLVDVDNDFVDDYSETCQRNVFYTTNGCEVKVSYIIENYMDKTPKGCNGEKKLRLSIKKIKDGNSNIKEINYLVEKVDGTICTK